VGLLLGALLLGALALGAFVVLGPSFTTARRATVGVDTAAAMGDAAGDVARDDAADSAGVPADLVAPPPRGGAPRLTDGQWLDGDGSRAAIEHVIAAGVSPPRVFPVAMPAYADQLSPEQIRLVAAYVFAISHPGSVVPDSLAAPADTAVRDTLARRR
jgi:hypothetical protein